MTRPAPSRSTTIKPVRAWVCASKFTGRFLIPHDIHTTSRNARLCRWGFEEVVPVLISPVTKPATSKKKKGRK